MKRFFCLLVSLFTATTFALSQEFIDIPDENPYGTFSLYGAFGPSQFISSYTGYSTMGWAFDCGFFYQTTSRFHIGVSSGIYLLQSDINSIGAKKLDSLKLKWTTKIESFSYKTTEYMIPLTVMGRYDFLTEKIKPYVGAGIGMNIWSKLETTKANKWLDTNDVDNTNLTMTFRLGVEYEFMKRWRVHAFTQFNHVFINMKPGESLGSFNIGITRTY